MKIRYIMISLTMLASVPAYAVNGDAAAGEAKSTVCAACHGKGGHSTIPTNPTLAGQNYTYIKQALSDYRSKKRKNPIMNGQAAALTDENIQDLAKFFSTQSSKLAPLPAK